ncbi:MAG: glutathionylspermidine synthase family protein [Deltaproteobacteria bacterium]|nr:glutathionylspermidine synthase family protein [Deltaproteobacteria bacterium]
MIRKVLTPRPGWQEKAEAAGFIFHHVDGEIYWDESVCYSFTLRQVEADIEDATQELVGMCLDTVADAVESEEILTRLAIPPAAWDLVRASWREGDATLYGRFDLAYDGQSPARMYEFNADTPTSLYESAYFQWLWLEDARGTGLVRKDADQYNSIQETLIETFASYGIATPMHFSCVAGSAEDLATVHYLRDCAEQAGITTRHIYIEDIGVDQNGQFIDLENAPIRHLFKLYPWEFMVRDAFAPYLATCDTQFFEPPWKMLLSNKGILPLLWERYTNHPNLLPAWFHDPYRRAPYGDFVLKPLFSREGANIRAFRDYEEKVSTGGQYGAEGYVGQLLCPPPFIDGHGPVIGSWVVNNTACGMGIREDDGPITGNLSRFVPHVIEG